jgi:hypothetical protein
MIFGIYRSYGAKKFVGFGLYKDGAPTALTTLWAKILRPLRVLRETFYKNPLIHWVARSPVLIKITGNSCRPRNDARPPPTK